ncbi:MAG: hypothetical protein ASARMPREDX12_002284 [Alectoria sarmentosa]|nr:MAG: hypothetical protein ASARMPREDX12_002284 [Alectoria sarmentosa]
MKETAATEKEKLMNPRKEDARAMSLPTVNFVNLESLEQAIEHMPLGPGDSKVSRLLTDDRDRDADVVCGDDIFVNEKIILGIRDVLGLSIFGKTA